MEQGTFILKQKFPFHSASSPLLRSYFEKKKISFLKSQIAFNGLFKLMCWN
jgi:hypothetical protein